MRGVELMKNAAENGHAKAQFMYGSLLINPSAMHVSSVEQDVSAGIEMLRKSSDQSFGMAECTLAMFYAQGIGVEKDLAKAKELYTRALEHGGLIKEMEDDATEMLAKLQGSSDDSNTGINDYSGIDESVEQEKNDETDAAVSTSSTVMGGGCLYEGV
jgi:TPR repeat protein